MAGIGQMTSGKSSVALTWALGEPIDVVLHAATIDASGQAVQAEIDSQPTVDMVHGRLTTIFTMKVGGASLNLLLHVAELFANPLPYEL